MLINNFKLIKKETDKYGEQYPHCLEVQADFDGETKTFYIDLSYSNFDLIDICPWGLPEGVSESEIKKAWIDNNFDWED